ncbi:MAG: hypothetical protein ACON4Z_04090 [Planctomycetota bacterium]
MEPNDRTPAAATAFREVISQWQLAARTEVKRASSLPSSMFDAADPMVEARLGETVAAMMRVLHRPGEAADADQASGEHLERRAEHVGPEELRALPSTIRRDVADADLDDLVASEYLNLLIDACTTGGPEVRAGARELLAQDFAVTANSDLDEAAGAIARCLRDVGAASVDGEQDLLRLEELCAAIAATVVIQAGDEERAP